MNNVLLPADTFIVSNKTVLNDKDRVILNMLYQPLVGCEAISLYYSLWSYLDKSEVLSNEWTHHHLLTNMRISINELVDSRSRLEAIGLIKTYYKKGELNNYIYELYSPVSASEFINNPILSSALFTSIGKLEYEKIIAYFKVPKLNLKEYVDISSRFSDIFAFSNIPINDNIIYDLKKSNYRKLEILSSIDLNTVLSLIPDDLLNKKSVTKETKDLIYKLSYIYNYDNDYMIEIIRNSISDKHTIDKNLLKENAEKFYKFENMGKLPGLIYKNQPEYLRKDIKDSSNRSKMIYMFETTSPYDFISSKSKSGNPTSSDLKILSYLLIDLNLKPGVVNVLVDYVLKINDNKLIKSFVDVIASQWSKSGIETVEDAMALAEKEYKKRKNIVSKNNTKKVISSKPSWFNKEIKEEKATDEDIKKLEERLASK